MLLTLLLVCPAWGGQDGQLLERLRVDHGALKAAERDFLQHQQQGNLGVTETREYAAYVDRLRQRVVRDCVALATAEVVVPANLDCPQQTPPIARPTAGVGFPPSNSKRPSYLPPPPTELCAALYPVGMYSHTVLV